MSYTLKRMVASSSEISVTIYTTLQGITSHKTVILLAYFGTSTTTDGKFGLAEKKK
jgi:hypothetical protein